MTEYNVVVFKHDASAPEFKTFDDTQPLYTQLKEVIGCADLTVYAISPVLTIYMNAEQKADEPNRCISASVPDAQFCGTVVLVNETDNEDMHSVTEDDLAKLRGTMTENANCLMAYEQTLNETIEVE